MKNQKPEIRNQEPETRNQRPVIRNQKQRLEPYTPNRGPKPQTFIQAGADLKTISDKMAGMQVSPHTYGFTVSMALLIVAMALLIGLLVETFCMALLAVPVALRIVVLVDTFCTRSTYVENVHSCLLTNTILQKSTRQSNPQTPDSQP